MKGLINDYFVTHLSLTRDEAFALHEDYFRKYGLAIEGLVKHHKIDALEYNHLVDDALPLETVLAPDPDLRRSIEGIDRSKVKLWLFTNAHVTHGKRVVRLLGVDDLFEGLSFCDYSKLPLICKPHDNAYEKAMKDAGVSSPTQCYFVDDSWSNIKRATELGWQTAHLLEPGLELKPGLDQAGNYQISSLSELRSCFPHLFKGL
jgi:pyrimidine and pyridine-specific 5'-nucleotidase